MIPLLSRVIPILTTLLLMPFLLSPVIRRNPSLSWFLITLVVRTDKRPGPTSSRVPDWLLSTANSRNKGRRQSQSFDDFLIFAVPCIYHQKNTSSAKYANFFMSISTPRRNKANKSHIIILIVVIYGSSQRPAGWLFTYNQPGKITGPHPPTSTKHSPGHSPACIQTPTQRPTHRQTHTCTQTAG